MSAEIRDKSLIQIISLCLIRGIASVNQQTNNDQNILKNSWHIIYVHKGVLWYLLPQEGKQELQEESIFTPWESAEKKRSPQLPKWGDDWSVDL